MRNEMTCDLNALRESGRLVKRSLPDGREVEFVERALAVAGFDAEARAVDVLASDASVDSYGDVIEVEGWDLSRYEKNPVVLINHRYTVESLVGTAVARKDDDGLRATITLDDPSLNPDAGMVARKLAAGSLRSVSVGFLPQEWELIRDEKGNWTGGFRFTKQALIEISFVPVPANGNAVIGASATPAPRQAPAVITPVETQQETRSMENHDKQMEATIKALQDKLEAQGEKMVAQDEWLKKVEDDLAKARRGSIVQDNLREAIPQRMLAMVESHTRGGAKDPVLAAAKDAWFKNHCKIASGQYNGQLAELREENARLEAAMGEVTRATFNENTATQGGNLVPSIVEAEIIRLQADAGLVRPLARKMTMTSKVHTIPSPTSVTAYVVAEMGTAITAGEPQVNVITMTAKDFVAYGLATYDVVQDSAIGIADMFVTLAAEAFGAKEDQLLLEGTAGDAFVGLAAASGVLTLDATTATNASAVPTYTALINMIFKAAKKASRKKGAFFFHPIAWSNIAGQVSTSLPVLQQAGFYALDPTGDADGRVGPYGVFCTEQIKSDRTDVGGTDVSYGYFGNFQYAILGDRTGIDFMASPHVKFAEGLVAMRLIKRTAGTIGVPAAFTMIKKVKTS